MPFGRRRASRSPPLAPRRRGVGEAVPETDLGEEVKTLDMVWARLPFMDAGGGGGGEVKLWVGAGTWIVVGRSLAAAGWGCVPGGGVCRGGVYVPGGWFLLLCFPDNRAVPSFPGGGQGGEAFSAVREQWQRAGGFAGLRVCGSAGLRVCGLETRSFLVRRGEGVTG